MREKLKKLICTIFGHKIEPCPKMDGYMYNWCRRCRRLFYKNNGEIK